MKSDVKAIRVTGTGSVFGGRTRLRGIILANATAGAGTITLQDGNAATQFVGAELVKVNLMSVVPTSSQANAPPA